ncbi:uncharacterized protein METZ01_LOCUS7975, partial [marine metagenome]
MDSGALLELAIERPAVGGRMIARHDGRVILVSGAIPGERVRARVAHSRRGVPVASTEEVILADHDRRPVLCDPSCGGNVFSHIAYSRQLSLKREIVADAFARIGRLPPPKDITIAPSFEQGYRLRARLYVAGKRVGFLRSGSHHLCDAAKTGQLSTETGKVIGDLQSLFSSHIPDSTIRAIDLAESVDGEQRVIHCWLDRERPADVTALSSLGAVSGIGGVSASVRR